MRLGPLSRRCGRALLRLWIHSFYALRSFDPFEGESLDIRGENHPCLLHSPEFLAEPAGIEFVPCFASSLHAKSSPSCDRDMPPTHWVRNCCSDVPNVIGGVKRRDAVLVSPPTFIADRDRNSRLDGTEVISKCTRRTSKNSLMVARCGAVGKNMQHQLRHGDD